MPSMLHRPAADSEFCRHAYLEEPGDVAEEVSRFNLATPSDVTPSGVRFWISDIASPLPFHVHPIQDYCIKINLGPGFMMDSRMSGEKRTVFSNPGSQQVIPAGCDTRLTYRGLGEFRSLTLSCNLSHFEQVAYNSGVSISAGGLAASCCGKHDPQALSLCHAIVEELKSEQGVPLLLESLAVALSIHVLRRAGGIAIESRRPTSGLAPYLLKRVTDYIQEHIQEPVSLASLASVAELSTYHFCRMFKQSTGIAPHQYLAQARITRAKQMLLQTSRPIGDIGFDTGLGSSSQFSHFFKKWCRCTPQEYRRQGRAMKPWSIAGASGQAGASADSR